MRYLFFIILCGALGGCSLEPSSNDLQSIVEQHNEKVKKLILRDKVFGVGISDVLGVEDMKIVSVEKLGCVREVSESRIYFCDVGVKYSISAGKNSVIDLVGFSGEKSELRRLKLAKILGTWEVVD